MFEQFKESLEDPYGEEIEGELPVQDNDKDIPDDEMVDIDDLYDVMGDLMWKANVLYCKFSGENPDEVDNAPSPEDAMESMDEIPEDSEYYEEATNISNEIGTLQEQIDEKEAEEAFEDDDED